MKNKDKGTTPMPNKAKLYVASTAAAGLSLLAVGLFQGAFPNLTRFASYFALALLASTLKLRLPGMTGTMSASFLLILMGIADYTFSQTIAMGRAAALLPSARKAKLPPKLVPVGINIAPLA